ncbi:FAD-binding monooxygenase [Brachybacterium saurashtrense]|uniref:3-hydroxybenzoate 4-monooxygenase n=1 Tax=Brachybacterium saurashtrense TaxID=556288 RepID=A0A345YQG6_9MICO|nr:FAD-binding monooxygenase [Brachybacterium saurashtrense]AXK46168.1 3-hydroxybenzoate 4-monooxygenase [Brachybacterium saurashtrense]RRR23908.1 3-hydroxybenzoate 4-monooxygenase [Brachybacterium saurashtrense]
MQFHHHGYLSTEPRVAAAAGTGIDRPDDLPDTMDVLIIGSGPAGAIAAAQLSQYPEVSTRLVERRPGRLELGQADGIQARSVETFQAFGFAERIIAEAYRITEMNFWGPDPENPQHIARTSRTDDDPRGVSEFPHLIVNQARVLDYYLEAAARGPARITPDYGWEFTGELTVTEDEPFPVAVTLRRTAGPEEGAERTVRAKHVYGCDGAHSRVRRAIGCTMAGDKALHAWGVMDVLYDTDFPDIRTKCAIQSHDGGSILLIPREGGYLVRMYVDLGTVAADDGGAVRDTPLEIVIAQANQILHPYTLEVRDVAWHSIYEVGHRVTDRFDDVPEGERGTRVPRVFIAGDACHTHSAKAGQGMNVSMQDGFNLAWKLGQVLSGRSPAALLDTYSAERQVVAQNLIDFDREWSSLMAKRPEELGSPDEVAEFYVRTSEFPAGFMTEYTDSMITREATGQELATGFPIGKRFKSDRVVRVSDANPLHLGHHARADGRWRLYAFADAAAPSAADSALRRWAGWLLEAPDSPVRVHTPAGADLDTLFDIKAIYQQGHHEFAITDAPEIFRSRSGPFALADYERVFATDRRDPELFDTVDIFDTRGISRDGAVVLVRPDQYVAGVFSLTDTEGLAEFFRGHLLPADHPAADAG